MVIPDDDVIVDEEVEEEPKVVEAVVTASPKVVKSEYFAVWKEDGESDWPQEVSEYNIIGYNSEGEEIGPVKVLAPDLTKAGIVAGMDAGRGPVRKV
jgi:hypothetical protein